MVYTQCQLEKGRLATVVWIPQQFAVLGKKLRVRHADGWDGGWEVRQVYRSLERREIPDAHKQSRSLGSLQPHQRSGPP